jgi:hypothetical protein
MGARDGLGGSLEERELQADAGRGPSTPGNGAWGRKVQLGVWTPVKGRLPGGQASLLTMKRGLSEWLSGPTSCGHGLQRAGHWCVTGHRGFGGGMKTHYFYHFSSALRPTARGDPVRAETMPVHLLR